MSQKRNKAQRRTRPEFKTVLAASMESTPVEQPAREPEQARRPTVGEQGAFARALQQRMAQRQLLASQPLVAPCHSSAPHDCDEPAAPAQPSAPEPSSLASTALRVRALAARVWSYTLPVVRQMLPANRGQRKLRVLESVSLGDKRFAAVLDVDGRRFLIGGGAGSVSLLTALDDATSSGQTPAGRGAEPFDEGQDQRTESESRRFSNATATSIHKLPFGPLPVGGAQRRGARAS